MSLESIIQCTNIQPFFISLNDDRMRSMRALSIHPEQNPMTMLAVHRIMLHCPSLIHSRALPHS